MDLPQEEWKLDETAMQNFAQKHGMEIMRTSSKDGTGVKEVKKKILELSTVQQKIDKIFWDKVMAEHNLKETKQRRTNCRIS
jgi:Fe2+ transport system protein B